MTLTPLTIARGDALHTTCTYDNTDGRPVRYGESTFDEMCFVVLFYTPYDGLNGCVN